jgi:hypothetical protein
MMDYQSVMFSAFSDELQKIAAQMGKTAMPQAMLAQAGKMFGGARKLVGQGLPEAMRAKIPSRVPRPGQTTGRLAPPARVPRPQGASSLGPVSRKAPPPPPLMKKKSPIDWMSGSQGLDFSGR